MNGRAIGAMLPPMSSLDLAPLQFAIATRCHIICVPMSTRRERHPVAL
jgi:hypothetical protein